MEVCTSRGLVKGWVIGGLGFGVWGLGVWVQGVGCGIRFRVQDLELRV
jgi:hypothetical protein